MYEDSNNLHHDSLFRTFRRWPLVPSPELLRIRAALQRCDATGTPGWPGGLSDSARELLDLVTGELERRHLADRIVGADGPDPGGADEDDDREER
ncbi:hypothetical protein AB6813_18765 [bacterium RCC_150]